MTLEIVKPQPTVTVKPAGVKTKWFRDPNHGYWVQLEVKTRKNFILRSQTYQYFQKTPGVMSENSVDAQSLNKYWPLIRYFL